MKGGEEEEAKKMESRPPGISSALTHNKMHLISLRNSRILFLQRRSSHALENNTSTSSRHLRPGQFAWMRNRCSQDGEVEVSADHLYIPLRKHGLASDQIHYMKAMLTSQHKSLDVGNYVFPCA